MSLQVGRVARKVASILNWELWEQGVQGVKQGLCSVTRMYPINQLQCHWCSCVHSTFVVCVYSCVRTNGVKLSMSRHNEHLCIMWSEQYACVWKCVHNWCALCERTARCVWSFQIHQIMFSTSMMKQNCCCPPTCGYHFDCWAFMCARVGFHAHTNVKVCYNADIRNL